LIEKNYEPKELIEIIQGLRYSEDAHNIALEHFVKYSALLVKAPIAVLLTQESQKEWRVTSKYGLNSKNQEEVLVSVALEMSTRVLKNGFSYARTSIEWLNLSKQISFAIKIDSKDKETVSFMCFIIDSPTQQYLSEMIIRTLMNSDIPKQILSENIETRKIDKEVSSDTKVLSIEILEILSKIIYQEKFLLASMFLVNEVATRFNCSQVSIGWEKGNYINPIAISHIDKFDKGMESVRKLEALYEESADQDEEIIYPSEELNDKIVFAHHHYIESTKAKEVASIPFRYQGRVIGVISCEKSSGVFSEEELILLRLLSNYITPWLHTLYLKDRWIGGRIALASREYMSRFFSLKNTFLKSLAVLISGLLIYGALGSWNYKIEVVSSLETDNIAFISAPFNGLVYSVNVHAGDNVKKGDTLLSFDKDELYLKESEALADINKYTSESEKARAKNTLADMRVALSKKKEAELNLERVQYYLEKSDILSPLEGVIIVGDKEELLGTPIAKGDLLFKVAQSTDLYLRLKVAESDIDEINIRLKGEFALLSSPEHKYNFKIENIIPMAEVDSTNGNIFVVQAKVMHTPKEWWRAGMSGVAKIEIGERNIFWILTHKFIESIRIFLWI
jgi:hypothetical protein